MTVSVVTPTANRPQGLALLEGWMARQTVQPDEWIVADGGISATVLMQGQRHLYDPSVPAGVENFLANLARGLRAATGDLIVIMEDDDWYDRTHLQTIVRQLSQLAVGIAGDPQQRYYHLPSQRWKVMNNKGASLCQTGFRRQYVSRLLDVIADRRTRATHPSPTERRRALGVDFYFWHAVPCTHWSLEPTRTVVGLKGLPGQAGLGIGHRPTGGWTPDPDGAQLQSWVGAQDQALYTHLGLTSAPGVE